MEGEGILICGGWCDVGCRMDIGIWVPVEFG